HEDHRFMGFGGELSAQITEKAFADLDAPVMRVGGAFTPIPFAGPLEAAALPSDADVMKAVQDLVEF
ncbi:MAG: transketolase C-terminal domain-containing protein, partial [Bacteroidota bacterium]